jgi:glycerol-3-phosphate O-acyltransferase
MRRGKRHARPSRKFDGEIKALAVSDEEPWWRAVNAVLEELEWEIIEEARQASANTTLCINALGASEGVALARQRLSELRVEALKGVATS